MCVYTLKLSMFPTVEGKPDRLKPKFDGPPGRNFIAIVLQARPDAPSHTQRIRTTRSADRTGELGNEKLDQIIPERTVSHKARSLCIIFLQTHTPQASAPEERTNWPRCGPEKFDVTRRANSNASLVWSGVMTASTNPLAAAYLASS